MQHGFPALREPFTRPPGPFSARKERFAESRIQRDIARFSPSRRAPNPAPREISRREPGAHRTPLNLLGWEALSRSRRRDLRGEASPLHFRSRLTRVAPRVGVRQQRNFCVWGTAFALPLVYAQSELTSTRKESIKAILRIFKSDAYRSMALQIFQSACL